MELSQIKVFVAVAQTLSFTRAADQLFITQPAVSYQIRSLETELGIKLFSRESNRIALTKEGQEFFDHSIEILKLTSSLESRMLNISRGMEECIKIASLRSCTNDLAQCVSDFSVRHPDIQIDIDILEASEMSDAITGLHYDLYFASNRMFIGNNAVDLYRIRESSMCLFFAQKYAQTIEPKDMNSLAELPFISVVQSDVILHNTILEICRNWGFSPKIISYCNRPETVLVLVGAGIGVSILPIDLASFHDISGVLTMPIEGDDAKIHYVFGWSKSKYTKAIHQFRDIVEERYQRSQQSV